MVSGDNSYGQLWCKKETQVTAKFIKATSFPFESKISRISHVSAWNQSIAFVFDDFKVFFRPEDGQIHEFSTGTLRQICCLENNVITLQYDGKVYNYLEKNFYQQEGISQIAASNNYILGLNNTGVVYLFGAVNEPAKEIEKDATAICCTGDEVFIIKSNSIIVWTNEDSKSFETSTKIIAGYGSETEALFIDTDGNLWHYDSDALLQVFGLPPVVFAAVGIQHYAAISYDGSLYTWGFNPSAQLGIGSDKPSNDPYHVLDGTRLVACGTHHTLAVCGGAPEIPEGFNNSVMIKSAKLHPNQKSVISRAELLY